MRKSGGRILVEEAYAQGKMLDSREWNGVLVRGITPSDLDYVVESGGYFLFAEFNRGVGSFDSLSRGQAILYGRLCEVSRKFIVAVVGHSAPKDRAICTKTDIASIEVRHVSGYRFKSRSPEESRRVWDYINRNFAEAPERLVRSMEAKHSRGGAA
jgi:hypothetical protein